jgi:hypothetical protein
LAAQAAFMHDENNYRQDVAKSPEFAPHRMAALATFARAADRYIATAPTLKLEEESVDAFTLWLYAGLGACDLGAMSEETQPIDSQPALVKAAISRLPGEAAERHLEKLANTLFTRLSAVNPAVKFRYLRAGFEVVGDHPAAYEARKVFDYYHDLVTEIRLVATVDGSDVVGTRPFGVRVDIHHTREIERESGGFGKYLQNQNSRQFAWNYGRPTEDYRDKFQEAASRALQEQFEVLSVTFNREEASSKALAEYGWRKTPYAYLLLEARGPQVDRIPELRLDLDFIDTSGYVVLPVTQGRRGQARAGGQGDRPRPDARAGRAAGDRSGSVRRRQA